MLPRVSARSSVSAARDGAGTTTTSTELLTMVVGPALPMNCTSALLLIEVPGGAAAAVAASSSASNAAARRKTGVNKRRGRSSFALLRPAEEE